MDNLIAYFQEVKRLDIEDLHQEKNVTKQPEQSLQVEKFINNNEQIKFDLNYKGQLHENI